MLIGYVRVSTQEQNEQRQIVALKEKNVDKIFTDKASGKNTERDALKEMLSFVRDGDTVITESISRVARSTRDLLNIIDILTHKKVEFISLKECIDTTTPQGKFMLTVFAAMAELERDNILQRQKEGIAIAKAKGKYKGGVKKLSEEQINEIKAVVNDRKTNITQLAKKYRITRQTIYNLIK